TRQQTIQLGVGGEFTGNSRWFIYTVRSDTTRAMRQRARRRRGPGGTRGAGGGGGSAADSVHDKVGIVELASGKSTLLDDVRSFAPSADGAYVALQLYPARGARTHGSDLVVRDLADGSDVSFGNVR